MLRASADDRVVVIGWDDGRESRFHHLWLRDNSPQARHPQTNHRVEETSQISPDIRPVHCTVTAADELQLQWDDGHESVYTADWLTRHDYSSGVRPDREALRLWDGSFAPHLPRIDHVAFSGQADQRIHWLRGFRSCGVAIMQGIPHEENIVLQIAESLGQVRTTSWGRIFDVKSMSNANAVAYTNLSLSLHTDEAYRDPAPTVQLTHFLVSEAEGGETTLVDGFKLAEDLRQQHPDKFRLLTETELHFHFRDLDIELEHEGPVIMQGPGGRILHVRYSNHSAQPFLLDPDRMEAFYDAYQTLGAMREMPAYRIQIGMNSGDMYMVDNRRVMHGRRAFRVDGNRHLQSCYIDRDELLGRLAVLERAGN
jgi:gamma-butyrobetaine dioxygenase